MKLPKPIRRAPPTPTKPAAGVMATNPPTAPVLMPTTVARLSIIHSNAAQVSAAAAAAKCVTISALAANPSAANPLPALKPKPTHPQHGSTHDYIGNIVRRQSVIFIIASFA